MLTGRKAFEGRSQASLIGAILRDQPPSLSSVQPLAPLALEHVVTTCLSKDPDERWQNARDLLRELKWIAAAPQPQLPTSGVGKARRSRSSWLWPAAAVTFALSTLALGLWALYLNRPNDAPPAIRFFDSRLDVIVNWPATLRPDTQPLNRVRSAVRVTCR